MEIKLKASVIKQIKGMDENEYIKSALRYIGDHEYVDIDIAKIKGEIPALKQYALDNKSEPGMNVILQTLSIYEKIDKDVKSVIPKTLPILKDALISLIATNSTNFMLCWTLSDGNVVFGVVYSITYTPTNQRHGYPADCTIHMKYHDYGEIKQRSVVYRTVDIRSDLNTVDILSKSGYNLVTERMHDVYLDDIEKYRKIQEQVGDQFVANGMAYIGDRNSWNVRLKNVGKSKLVCDTNLEKLNRKSNYIDSNFWKNHTEEELLHTPIHPYVEMYDITNHVAVSTHVNLLEPYVYDENIYKKLILPEEIKSLIDVLIVDTDDIMEDIVKGKTGGIIVMASGDPGLGKTLTAEVYSEKMKRPLYSVQCSQLGLKPEEIETKLQMVLDRAQKWSAILLIDEADVFVRERGVDIHQNAIVGVFLRILELYDGVLFMTTNRAGTDEGGGIDDAILSRCTAHIRYPRPTKEDQKKIWRILADQYKAEIGDTTIDEIVEKFDWLSGRDIKTLLKLSNLMAKRDNLPITLQTVTYVSNFHNISKNKFVVIPDCKDEIKEKIW